MYRSRDQSVKFTASCKMEKNAITSIEQGYISFSEGGETYLYKPICVATYQCNHFKELLLDPRTMNWYMFDGKETFNFRGIRENFGSGTFLCNSTCFSSYIESHADIAFNALFIIYIKHIN